MSNKARLPRSVRSGLRTLRLLSEGREAQAVLLLALLAWLVLAFPHRSGVWIRMCLGAGSTGSDRPSRIFLDLAGNGHLPVWHMTAMTIAMMAPLGLVYYSGIRDRIIQTWRLPALGTFTLTYTGVWLAFAVLADEVRSALIAYGADPRWLLAAITSLALLWQASPSRRRIAGRHHRLFPVPASGWQACQATGERGLSKAGLCLASCGPMMLIPLFAAHHVGAMALVALLALFERTSVRTHTTLIQAGLAGAGLLGTLVLN